MLPVPAVWNTSPPFCGIETVAAANCVPLPTGLIVKVRLEAAVPALLLALSVTVEVPAAVGLPEINPVAVFIDKPGGKPVAP